MADLNAWAARHGVPWSAVVELRAMLGEPLDDAPVVGPLMGEAAVQQGVRLEASARNWRVFRNNVGGGKLEDGSFVRWGLANDSKSLNDKLKSSDLIGWRPRLIGPSDIGRTIAQFTSLEVKAGGWRYSGTPRETAQLAWLQLVNATGGHGQFVTHPKGLE